MANISEWAAAGLDAIHVAARSTGGFMAGFSNLDATDINTGDGMRRLRGAQTAPLALPEPNRVPIRGDNGRITTFQFNSDGDNAFTLEMGVTDAEFEALASVKTTYALGEWDMIGRGSNNPSFENIIMLLTRNAESQETASQGSAGFDNLLLFNVKVLPIGDAQWADSAEGGTRYACTADPVTVTPWGVTCLSAFGQSTQVHAEWFSEYRSMLHVFIGDNSTTTVVLDYTPIHVDKIKCFNADTGAAITVSSVNTGTKTVTLGAAVPSGKFGVLIYETTGF